MFSSLSKAHNGYSSDEDNIDGKGDMFFNFQRGQKRTQQGDIKSTKPRDIDKEEEKQLIAQLKTEMYEGKKKEIIEILYNWSKDIGFSQRLGVDINTLQTKEDVMNAWNKLMNVESFNIERRGDQPPIIEVPDEFYLLRGLKHLTFQGKMVAYGISWRIGNLVSLISLKIIYTSIFRLPEEIGSLPFLKTLMFVENRNLMKIPRSFGKLKELDVFILTGSPSVTRVPIDPNTVKSFSFSSGPTKYRKDGGLRHIGNYSSDSSDAYDSDNDSD